MTAVVDSGPLISLAAVGQVELLREQCGEILIVPAVEREVIAEGQGRAGEAELRAALTAGWARRVPPLDQALIARLRRPALALADSEVLACAVAHGRVLVVTDDAPLRRLAIEEQLPLVGTVGVLVRARLDGRLPALKPLLDQLVASGFRLDPAGSVYRDALARVGEAL
jgi:predicted nucleic acid-binding protein